MQNREWKSTGQGNLLFLALLNLPLEMLLLKVIKLKLHVCVVLSYCIVNRFPLTDKNFVCCFASCTCLKNNITIRFLFWTWNYIFLEVLLYVNSPIFMLEYHIMLSFFYVNDEENKTIREVELPGSSFLNPFYKTSGGINSLLHSLLVVQLKINYFLSFVSLYCPTIWHLWVLTNQKFA